MKILLVEDNQEQASYIRQGMAESGHHTDHAEDGHIGLVMALNGEYDLIITDRMMPRTDGLQMLRALRAAGNQTPTLILSALDSVDDRVEGLRGGGDDYLIKPFAFSELLARAEILARRSPVTTQAFQEILQLADLQLNRLNREVSRAAHVIQLNNREFQILEYFLSHPERVITRTMLLEQVWGYNFDPQTNVIDVHIGRLRKKIDLPDSPPLLHTIRGAGYKLSTRP
ncbi:winged helix-turn-helix domain-containing protein [Aliamphritea ceti]|uniref:winged helix-turn-helix domain-containing protein n=1 Tax=Aliamphritea ceti TaxID=1524258 RepID=UPI0021C278E1|nr:response regulator transcription factor [Aliamphritea ceti]